MIKFNKYNVTNTETKEKARVHYSIGNRTDGRTCVTIYEKSYGNQLHKVFKGAAEVQNDSDMMTDYFENSRVVLFENHPLYEAARKQAA